MNGNVPSENGESRIIQREAPIAVEPEIAPRIELRDGADRTAQPSRSLDEWLRITGALSAVRTDK